jgi:chondroitin-sulfate-ABC endolyase/exolyase
MLVQTTPEKMATFANQMATPQTAPVQIIRKDNSAHIVFDRETQSTGYVLFTPADNLTGLVKSVDRPCFVMTQSVGNTLKMSVANTVLSDKNQSLPVRLTLPGAWKLPATATKRIKVNASQTETYLEVTPDSNLAFEFQLVK